MKKRIIGSVFFIVAALGIALIPVFVARAYLTSARTAALVPDAPEYLAHTTPKAVPNERLLRLLGDDMHDIDSVPRLFLTRLPENLTDIQNATEKKRMFSSSMLPLILRANELIVADRARILEIRDKITINDRVRTSERKWLKSIMRTHRIDHKQLFKKDAAEITKLIDDLLYRVDIIPPSLALAQAAMESGWGTSYFAQEGNALFGEWVWGDAEGILPRGREEGKNHKIKKFDYLLDSVRSYMVNLNRHNAYEDLRRRRAELRQYNVTPTGARLAPALVDYSERGAEYVTDILSIINYNGLDSLDYARLSTSST